MLNRRKFLACLGALAGLAAMPFTGRVKPAEPKLPDEFEVEYETKRLNLVGLTVAVNRFNSEPFLGRKAWTVLLQRFDWERLHDIDGFTYFRVRLKFVTPDARFAGAYGMADLNELLSEDKHVILIERGAA